MSTVWIGALSGCGVALVVGVIFIIIFYVAQNSVFSGNGKTIFEGLLMLVASYLITLLGFAMLKIRGYEAKWERKLQRQAAAQAAAQTDTTVSQPACCHSLYHQAGPYPLCKSRHPASLSAQ